MSHEKEPSVPEDLRLATFSERVLAFLLDILPFGAGYLLLSDLVFKSAISTPSQRAIWLAMWTALFILYQAFSSSDDRVSLGKRALGLKVVNFDNEPLTLPQAVMRSATYLLSGAGSLGFIWSLLNPSRQCWHDMVVGSVVVVERSKPLKTLRLVRAGALASLAILAVGFMWTKVWEPRYQRVMLVAYAHVGLNEMSELQKTYYAENGRYADNIFALSNVSVAPMPFLREMTTLFDSDSGIDITTTKKGFKIVARARDTRRTQVILSGPA